MPAGRSTLVARTTLCERLSGAPETVALIAAPAGSGKTLLLRAWIEEAGLAPRTAWVSVGRDERDPQHFWLEVADGLRAAVGPAGSIERPTPTPEFDGDAFVGRLISSLAGLQDPVVLVVDDLHELTSPEALAQLETLITERPHRLRIVLATRHDPPLGLHRLRLAGQLTELRAADLRFTLDEARQLLAGAGVALSDEGLERLHARTEGWAAGLRLATLSLVGRPDPERLVEAFSGSERTVADYLLAEVLERQPAPVRTLLLRTSILDRVSGPLADRVLGTAGSERLLLELEATNAFVTSLDADRTWFRYHQLFADLLRLELRRTSPELVPELNRTASAWYAEHGLVVEAIRHSQAAEDWETATRLVTEHAFGLTLDGQGSTVQTLLDRFPTEALGNPELAVLVAYRELTQRSLETAAATIGVAERNAGQVSGERRYRLDIGLAITRLVLARARGDLEAVLREVAPLLGPLEAGSLDDVARASDARAVALLNLGIVELWSFRLDDARRHLERALALARENRRPYVEVGALAHLAIIAAASSLTDARRLVLEAMAVADANGWTADPIAAAALGIESSIEAAHGRFGDARRSVDRALAALLPEIDPATALLVHFASGEVLVGESRLRDAIDELRVAGHFQSLLATPHVLTGATGESIALLQLRLGDVPGARATLATLTSDERSYGEARVAAGALALAEGQPQAAIDAVADVIRDQAPVVRVGTVVQARVLDAQARDRLGDRAGAVAGLERALDLAEPDGLVFPFLMTPAPALLERHPRHETAHAALLTEILDVLRGAAPRLRADRPSAPLEALSETELRVLRYLPSNLSAGEIASELYVSTSTVKTHMRHIYDKLDAHRRTEAVDRARDLGLLGPSGARRA